MSVVRKQESSALIRCKQLVRRTAFDLNLAHDAAMSAKVPFASLARIKRARREMNDLLRELAVNAHRPDQAENFGE